MKKIVLLVLFVSLVIPTLLLFPGISVRACGGREPVTLLGLVRQSKTIHIATFRGQEVGELQKEEEGDLSYREIKRNFDVSSTLKGETAKFVTLPNRDYVYEESFNGYETLEQAAQAQNPESENPPSEQLEVEPNDEPEDPEGEIEEKELKPGDSVLLFLTTDEESKELELVEYVDGIKNLPPADMAVYEARIKEIIPVLAAKKPNTEKIIDWLVRLAEDPVTRWEGSYELEQSFYAMEQKEAIEAEQKNKPEKEDKAPGETPYSEENPYKDDGLETGLTTLFARSLGDYHKQTLANILLDSRFRHASKKTGSDGMVPGDRELMSIVARWADNRVAAMFIEQLSSGAFSAYDNASLMAHISVILGDKNLSAIADKFDENSYRDDGEEVEAGKPAERDTPVDVLQPKETESAAPVDDVKRSDVSKSAAKESIKKPVLTYKRLRDDLTAKFLKRADAIMAKPQVGQRNKLR